MNVEEPFVHRKVSAVGTTPPSAAESSPFRMGQRLAPLASQHTDSRPAPESKERGQYLMPRARQALAAAGTLTLGELGHALGESDEAKLRKLVDNGVRAGHWRRGKNAEDEQVNDGYVQNH